MFLVKKEITNEFEQFVLQDDATGTQAVIIPDCGAILQSFSVMQNGSRINVIESYSSQADFKTNAESKGFRNIKMSPFACRIKNAQYSFEGIQYNVEKFLLNGSAIHGLLYNEPFTVNNTWATETSAGVSLYCNYNGKDKGYPFTFRCEVTYELKAGNALTLSTSVINKTEKAIPVMDGWHPYFTFGGIVNDLLLEFKSDSLVEFDDTLVPTKKLIPYTEFTTAKKLGDTFFDNCFTLKNNSEGPACTLTDTAKHLQLEIYPDSSYPYLQIYTPPHRNSIAIENISGAPNAFNNGMGLIILQPETAAQFTTTYKITSPL
ncbi:MAG: aldose 1-epimerase [Bacteroidia bacterium]|nr:aldose 1-epimerase [Bacteroidia bacterium]